MPHLTRRFTLLRAPDGSVVTPDTMRAHLRAQRARARAAGQPGAGQQHFLTEQEEDEIIEQMRAQARLEGNHHASQQQTDSMFGGTDGFGGGLSVIGSSRFDPSSVHSAMSNDSQLTSVSGPSNSADRMGSLTESLGDLRTLASSSSSGSLFSGRSSERDNAYLRGLRKSSGRALGDASTVGTSAAIAEETEEDEAEKDSIREDPTQRDDETDGMPGGFGGSQRVSKAKTPPLTPETLSSDGDDEEMAKEQGQGASRLPQFAAKQPRKSQLLSTLSPEAFNRVSLALEEVIGGLAPGVGLAEDEADDYDFEAGSTESESDGEADERTSEMEEVGQESKDSLVATSPARGNNGTKPSRLSSSDDDHAADADDEDELSAEGMQITDRMTAVKASPTQRPSVQPHPPTPASITRSMRSGRANGDGATSPESDAVSFQSAREEAPPQSNYHARLASSEATEPGFLPTEPSQATLTPRLDGVASGDGDDQASGSFNATVVADEVTPRIPQQESPSRQPQYNGRGSGSSTESPAPQGSTPPVAMASPHLTHLLHKRAASASSGSMGGGQESSPSSPSTRFLRPMSPESSNHEAPVLSASAIAARNQHRFQFPPNASHSIASGFNSSRVPDNYASGFRTNTVSPAAGPSSRQAPQSPPAVSSHQALAAATRGNDPRANLTPQSRHVDEVPDSRGLFPRPPQQVPQNPTPAVAAEPSAQPILAQDPDNGSSADALSDTGISEFERQFEQDPEGDDVWAMVARNLEQDEQGEHFETLIGGTHPYSTNQDGPASDRNGLPSSAKSGGVMASNRPISHIPPAEAATQFSGADFSMDQLAEMQASLVRNAGAAAEKNQQPHAAPTVPLPPLPSNPSAGSPISASSTPVSPHTASGRLEKARERARMIADRTRSPVNGSSFDALRTLSPSASWDSSSQPMQLEGPGTPSNRTDAPFSSAAPASPRYRHSPQDSSVDVNLNSGNTPTTSAGPSAGMTKSSSMRSFRSQVLYDVTTSHRPTSPPPRNTSSVASGSGANQLPSLHDITSQQQQQESSYQPIPPVTLQGQHESASLSHAVDATADRYLHRSSKEVTGQQDEQSSLDGGAHADPGRLFNAAGGYPDAIPEEARDAIISYDEYDGDASNPYSPDQSYSQQTQEQMPSWASAYNGQGQDAGDSSLLSAGPTQVRADSFHASPASIQSGWSDRSGRRNIVDDVAAQARAATQALKGPHSGDGGPYVRPKKSKTLSTRKSRKNPGKVISTPQLMSTSQHMDHAAPIRIPDKAMRQQSAKGKGGKPVPVRQATDYKNDPKIGPVTLLDRRASSSFGHEGQLPQSPYMPPGRDYLGPDYTNSPARMGAVGANDGHLRSPGAQAGASWDALPAASSAGSVTSPRTNTAAQDGHSASRSPPSTQSKTLGRIMSRIRMRKASDGNGSQAAIDPWQHPTSAVTNQQAQMGGNTTPSGYLSSPSQTRSHTPRGASPFGLSAGLSAHPERTLPESGASKLAGMFHSPGAAFPPQLSPSRDAEQLHDRQDAERDKGQAKATFSSADAQASSVGLGIGSQGLSPSGGHLPPRTPPGDSIDQAVSDPNRDQSAGLGSPAPIEDSRFEDNSEAADTSTQTVGAPAPLEMSSARTPTREGLAAANSSSSLEPADSQQLPRASEVEAADRNSRDAVAASSDQNVNATNATDADKRKSLRDTIVRRTLIFPSDASVLEEKRKSLASISSRRKSRRHGDVNDEANASYAALMGGHVHSEASPRASREGARASSTTAGVDASGNTLSTSSARQSRHGGGRTTSLRPPSPDAYSRRASGAQSSYAGSLYDMYVGDDGESVYDGGFSGDDPRASLAPGALTGRNHIEVTERADGSVVWQVIAGLGGQGGDVNRSNATARMSNYTGISGHSRANSEASQMSFLPRASVEMSPSHGEQSQQQSQERTFTGLLKDEDARSLFAKKRQPDHSRRDDVPALPDLPLQPFDPTQLQQLQQQQRLAEENHNGEDASRPSSIGGARPSLSLFRPYAEQQQQQQQLAFDMATPTAGVTRVVYSNDVELEQLLESLAKQTDAAKFHFDPRNHVTGGGGMSSSNSDGALLGGPIDRKSLIYRPASQHAGDDHASAQRSSGPSIDPSSPTAWDRSVDSPAGQQDSDAVHVSTNYDTNRRRVEDEIMSLLNATQSNGASASGKRVLSYMRHQSSGSGSSDLLGLGAGSATATSPFALERIEDEEGPTVLGG